MPQSLLVLDPDKAGPHQWVTARCIDGSINFLSVPKGTLRVLLTPVPRAPITYGHVSYWAAAVAVVDARTISFQLLDVGKPGPVRMPPDVYRVSVTVGGWMGRGQPLEVLATTPSSLATMVSHSRSMVRGVALRATSPFRSGAWALPFMPYVTPVGSAAFAWLFRMLTGTLGAPVLPMLTMAALADLRYRIRMAQLRRQGTLFAGTSVPDSSLDLLVDGEANFGAVHDLIQQARSFIYVMSLGLDEDTGLGPSGGGVDPRLGLALRAATLTRPPGTLDVKVLIFDAGSTLIDQDDWNEPHFTNVRDMSAVPYSWGTVRDVGNPPPNAVHLDQARAYLRGKTHAPDWMLNEFVNAYLNAGTHDTTTVLFPTGIQVARSDHSRIAGSHHQKMVLTERGMWIGGLNLQKQYWDRPIHHFRDPDRAHSGEGPSSSPVSPLVMPWHDVGVLMRGALLPAALELFALRWDAAVQAFGAYGPILSRLSGVDALVTRLRATRGEITDSRVARHRQSSPPHDPAFDLTVSGSIIQRAALATTLAAGVGFADVHVTHIRDVYEKCLEQLDDVGSFAYFENQFFTSYRFGAALHSRWERNVGSHSGEQHDGFPPFAYVLLPYVPQPNIELVNGLRTVVFDEMQILKWLEIRTARKLLKRDPQTGKWIYAWGVSAPQRNIVIDDPHRLSRISKFVVIDAIPLDPDSGEPITGGTPQTEQFQLNEVMSVSDIMSFTLAARATPYGVVTTNRAAFPNPPERRLHDYLKQNHVYVHSKVACMHDKDLTRCFATIGSANLNPRSLDEDGDSELNVFVRDENRVLPLREELFRHLYGRTIGTKLFADLALENLNAILEGNNVQLDGLVVRLDVMARELNVS